MGVIFVEVLFDICFCFNFYCYCGIVFIVVDGFCYCYSGGLYVCCLGVGIIEWFYFDVVVGLVGGVVWFFVGGDVFFVV